MGLYSGDTKIARLCLAASVMKTISTKNINVRGVTSVDDKLFVLLQRDVNQVAVYSMNDYQLLRHLNLPGLKSHDRNDLTSCVRHKCLYMSDNNKGCICRYDLATNATSRWEVPSATPKCLSVTPSCNLLVTCQRPNKLVELSADSGQCVREIALQSDIVRPWHAVQLTSGQYVICHGSYNSLHRVCVVDGEGKVTHSYGGKCGPLWDQLNMPSHVAVDEDSQYIFAADCFNERVTLLSPTLEYADYYYSRIGNSCPCRLYLHHTTRRLYVGQAFGDVVVIQL